MTYFLYGPPGSGKTTTGRILAQRLSLPFWDLDTEIEVRVGRPIAKIFDRGGEAELRAQERQSLVELLAKGPGVVALGGGALLHPENLSLALAAGPVLCLSASDGTLSARLQGKVANRPLLRGDARLRLRELLAERDGHYRSFALQLRTDGLDPEQAAGEAELRLGAFHLCGIGRGCDVRLQSGGIQDLGMMIHTLGLRGPVIVVSDRIVASLYAEACLAGLRTYGYTASPVTLPNGEAAKGLRQVLRLWQAFHHAGMDRETTVVSLGGGVVSDTAGFAAATFHRGIPWICVPTTLLAMVDAGLGGKTGINLGTRKNLVGAFHAPRLVLADPDTLRTLPHAEWRSGVAEAVKHGVIGDPVLLDLLSAGPEHLKAHTGEVIPRAMAVKVRVVEADPYERGVRATLNFGHTVGHGLEMTTRFRLRHGEAVSIGMVVEARLAEWMGLATGEVARPLSGILTRSNLPTAIPRSIDRGALVRAMAQDKKRRNGEVRFALPSAFGKVLGPIEAKGWDDWIMSL